MISVCSPIRLWCYFVSYPPSFRRMSAGVGVFFVQWVFGPDWIHSFIAAHSYLCNLCCWAQEVCRDHRLFCGAGLHLGCHAYRMYVNYLAGTPYHMFPLDFTGVQMVITMKLTSFGQRAGWTCQEVGSAPSAQDDKLLDKKALAAKKLLEKKDKYAITEFPNPLEFSRRPFALHNSWWGQHLSSTIHRQPRRATIRSLRQETLKLKTMTCTGRCRSVTDMNAAVAAIHRMILGVMCIAGCST